MEQRTFPDLENWEDSSIKIKQAHDAVTKLRIYHQQQEEEIRRIFDVSCGFQNMVYGSCNEVDHGDEGLDISVSPCSCPCGLK